MWDVGELVTVTGESFAAALSIDAGDVSREGEINQRLIGRPIRVRGRLRRTSTGVTAIDIGLETQDAARAGTDTTLYSVALGAAGTWVDFDGWITPDSDQVWGRPYISVSGTSGAAEIGEVFLQRSPQGLIGAADTAPGDFTNSWPTRATSTVTYTNSDTTGNLLFEKAIITRGGPIEIILSYDIKFSSGDPLDTLIYIDATYAGGATPTGYRRKATWATGTAETTRHTITIHEPVGDPQDLVGDPPLSAGAHTIRVYIRNATNQSVEIDDRSLQVREFVTDVV
ncbi:MAG: hypothetical protein KF842_06730 [Caulobacter sp.]|nr:hypothetical protein [Caulobacter sp.]